MSGLQRRIRQRAAFWHVLAVLCCAAACKSDAVKQKCTPGVNVFCRCPDNEQTGLFQCLPSGMGFGPCLPCDPIAPPEDTGRRRVEDTAVEPPDAAAPPDSSVAEVAAETASGKCPYFGVALTASKDVALAGDTSKAKATLTGLGICSVANTAKDIVYEVTADERGKVTAVVTPAPGYDAVLYARKGPCASGDQLACGDKAGGGGAETAEFFVEANDKFYVAVDGKNGSGGSYTLKIHLAPGSYCGDGVVDPEEACDDGNTYGGDGCSAKCVPDGAPKATQNCPGQTVHVWQLPVEISSSTDNNPNLQKASCGGGGGREAIYAVVPHRTGVMMATASSDVYDVLVYARSENCLSGTEVACANKVKGNGPEVVEIPVENEKPIWVFVDGYKYGKGPFKLKLEMEE